MRDAAHLVVREGKARAVSLRQMPAGGCNICGNADLYAVATEPYLHISGQMSLDLSILLVFMC